MAKFDMRLLPLVQTLIEVGADWLAFELIDIVQNGDDRIEPAALLAQARELIRQNAQDARPSPSEPSFADSPYFGAPEGDAQIMWAVSFVVDRLRDAVGMLRDGIENLETVAGIRPEIEASAIGITLVLKDGSEQLDVDRLRAAEAFTEIGELEAELRRWGEAAHGESLECHLCGRKLRTRLRTFSATLSCSKKPAGQEKYLSYTS
jgi:hypothetical protein